MRRIGVDAHKHYAHVVELKDGEVAADYRIPLPGGLEDLQGRLGPDAQVVMEASTSSFCLQEELAPHADRVVVAHPAQTRGAVAHSAMTDRKAAEALARLLASGFVRPVWVPPAEIRALRGLVVHRTNLTRMHSGLVMRVRALLQQELRADPGRRLLKPESLAELGQAFAPGSTCQVYLDSLLRLREHVSAERDEADKLLRAWCLRSREARLLLGLPGVGPLVAVYMVAAIGDVSRFASAGHLCSYAGLVPRIHQSGTVAWRGRISRAGRGSLRWAAWMASLQATLRPGPLQDFYRSLAARRPKRVAMVATSRRLLAVVWRLLRGKGKPREYDPVRAEEKLRRLERTVSRSGKAEATAGRVEQFELERGPRLDRFFDSLGPQDRVALGAARGCNYYHRLLEPRVGEVQVANTRRVRVITGSTAKSDRNDSFHLAMLALLGYLPTVFVRDEESQCGHELLQHRHQLVRDLTETRNQVRAFPATQGITVPASDLRSETALTFLRRLQGQLELTKADNSP